MAPYRPPPYAADERVVCCAVLVIFVLEIVLKLTEHFWAFWASNWNIADFIVTFVCVVLEFMRFSIRVIMDNNNTTWKGLFNVKYCPAV